MNAGRTAETVGSIDSSGIISMAPGTAEILFQTFPAAPPETRYTP